jgi:hypothetical protein
MTDAGLGNLVHSFGQGTVQQQYDALRTLILQRKHHAAAKESVFNEGIERLYRTAVEASGENDKLLALATLGRLASTIKRMRGPVYEEVSRILIKPLPPPSLLSEPEDRSYVGFLCERADPQWAIEYCARAVVFEEAGEQARVAFMKALIVLTGDLASAIGALVPFLQEYRPTTEDPGTSVTRRLRRIMAALREAVAETLTEPGEEPGRQLSTAIMAAFKGVEPAKLLEPLFDTADEAAAVIHEMVRLRFSLATEAATYASLKLLRERMSARDWERCVAESESMKRVASDISEAILILARQNIADVKLASELNTAAGSPRKGKSRLNKLAKQAGLPTEMKTWLVDGTLQEEPVEEQKGESRQLSEDSQLGDILVDSLRFRTLEKTAAQLLPELTILDPRISEEISKLTRTGISMCDALDALGRRRDLRVRGNVGDEEAYAPLEHEVIGGSVGSRRVRIIRPVVEQVREDGVAFVICKGLVEPIM